MKKIISLCLVVVMLLGMVAMTASAEGEGPTYDGYYVSLGEDIILNFSFANLDANTAYTATINGEEAEVIVDGTTGVVQVTSLTPGDINIYYTVALLADGETVATSAEKSVKDYCMWALTNMDLSNDVHNLVVDLLNYAAASQKYMGAAVTANADLSDLQKALASVAPTDLDEYLLSGNNGGQITWTFAQPVLGESVAYRFGYSVSEYYLNDYSFRITMGDETFVVNETYWTAKDGAYIEFIHLNPADLCTDVVVVAVDENGNPLSSEWTFSAERYASYAKSISEDSDDYNPNLVPLMDTILAYSKGAANYNAVGETNAEHLFANQPTRYASVGTFTAAEEYRLSNYNEPIEPVAKTDSGYFWYKLASTIYAYAGVDFSDYAKFGSMSASRNQIITNAGDVFVTQSFIYDMLVPGSYGGTSSYIKNIEGGGRLTLEQYQAGDIVFFGTTGSDAYAYSAVYLGNDRFIMMYGHANKAGTSQNSVFASLEEVDAKIDSISKTSYWMVLRPSNMNYRSISDYALTAAEQAKLATLSIDSIGATYYNSGRFLPYIYGTMGVALTDSNGKSLVANCAAYAGLLTKNGINTESRYYPMLVNESWGGAAIAESCGNYVMALADFDVGDVVIFSDQESASYDYWTWVYIGEGNFIVEKNAGTAIMTYDELVEIMNYANGLELTVDDAKNPELFTYLVLRPSQLAN